MKTFGFFGFKPASAALVFAAFSTAAMASGVAQVGQAAPNFSLKDTAGKTVQLSDFKGKTVVLEWTNPGCPFVVKHYREPGNMQGLQKEAAAAKGVVWLSINSTGTDSRDYLEPAKLAAWGQERGAKPAAMLMDEGGAVGKSYGAKTTPHMYIVDASGKLAYAGAIDSIPSAKEADIAKATNHVRAGLADLKAGKAVATASTQPYGCSVKYKS